MKKGIGSHHASKGINNEWLTPPEIVKSLGEFDLDPCSPVIRPLGFDTAKRYYTIYDDGLKHDWEGRVWLNPPYDRTVIGKWMARLALHQNGICFIFARTETQHFQRYVFDAADSVLFMEGRVNFYNVMGDLGDFNGGAPSALIAYGKNNVNALGDSGIKGKHLLINAVPIIVVGINRSWKTVVTLTLEKLDGSADIPTIYRTVERLAPEKTRSNNHVRAKIRQTLQLHFKRIRKGHYSL